MEPLTDRTTQEMPRTRWWLVMLSVAAGAAFITVFALAPRDARSPLAIYGYAAVCAVFLLLYARLAWTAYLRPPAWESRKHLMADRLSLAITGVCVAIGVTWAAAMLT